MSDETDKAPTGTGRSSVQHRFHRAINARWVIRSHTLARWDGDVEWLDRYVDADRLTRDAPARIYANSEVS